jgi:hypothetical protein
MREARSYKSKVQSQKSKVISLKSKVRKEARRGEGGGNAESAEGAEKYGTRRGGNGTTDGYG